MENLFKTLGDMFNPNKPMEYSKIDNIVFDGIDHEDAPDFSDSFIVSADHDGVPMTDEQVEIINEDEEFVHTRLLEFLY